MLGGRHGEGLKTAVMALQWLPTQLLDGLGKTETLVKPIQKHFIKDWSLVIFNKQWQLVQPVL